MKKRKLKNGFRNIIFFIVFASVSVFATEYFGLWEKAQSIFDNVKLDFGKVYVEKPKVRIIDESSKTRPVGVSINNNHAAWPHAGLQDAYLCYELIAEGGITRILAFYKDQDTSKIGSVRSARHYFLDYILENDAVFVHFGQSPQALSDIKSLKIDNLNGLYDSSVFYRDKSLNKAYEHTAFTTISLIEKGIKSKKYRDESDEILLKYSPTKVDYSSDESIKDANNITIEYSSYQTTSYVYDEETMTYKMFMDSKAHNDAVTKKQYTVKNIITYKVKNSSISSSDNKGRQELDNIGSGDGYYISNGKVIKIKWSKKSRSAKTLYTLANGEELVVNDGNTWIHIQPTGKTLKIE
ncbi:MAG: DUF3048 domain-containing protein [Tenericutes bacterium]|nr:DUF3048 domain-containing protein [Mycoplasmatota bacterium]